MLYLDRKCSILLCYFFLLNIIGNGVWLLFQPKWLSFLLIIILSAFCAVIEIFIFKSIPSHYVRNLFAGATILLHNFIGVTDYFLLGHFGFVIDKSVLDTLLVTNGGEVSEFISEFLSPFIFAIIIIVVIIVNAVIYSLSNYIGLFSGCKKAIFFCAKSCVLFLICCVVLTFIFQIQLQLSTLQYHAFSRVVWEYIRTKNEEHIGELLHVCQDVKATITNSESLKIIIIIGESHSVYHTSLYGYEKKTYPLMEKRREAGELFVYDNAITTGDVTYTVMKSVFSLDSMGVAFNETPIFPAVFKSAGYKTYLYDNEYSVDKSRYFMTDKTLSMLVYTSRNTTSYSYDGDMVDKIFTPDDSLALCIFHLKGQHISYDKRYPERFEVFRAENYNERFSYNQRKDIASYDNACLYNDFVINEIIKKYEDYNSVVVYFSDHGEEVFELRDYKGHGTAQSSSNMKYQIRIPLWVWLSQKYRQNHSQIIEKLNNACHAHITIDDISHFLLDLARIKTNWFSPSLSFIDPTYNHNKHRYIFDGIDYDDI